MMKIGDVVVFIDSIMVEMETKERHDNIVEEVLRRVAENDLFIKLEKCMWKVREVGFLEGVIGPDRVKMDIEKVQRVVDWLVPGSVIYVQKFLKLANYYR